MHILHVLNAFENTPAEPVEGVDPLDKVGFDPWRLLLFNAAQGGLDFLHCLVQHRLSFQPAHALLRPHPLRSDSCAEKPSSGCQEIPVVLLHQSHAVFGVFSSRCSPSPEIRIEWTTWRPSRPHG